MSICFATSNKLDAAILHCNSDTNYSELVHTPYVKYVCVCVCVCVCARARVHVHAKSHTRLLSRFSHVPFFVTLWTVAC